MTGPPFDWPLARPPWRRQDSRYTRFVASWIHRTASLVVVVVLAGTPAMAAVCAALCMPGMAHTPSHPSRSAPNTLATSDAAVSSHHHTLATLVPQHEPTHTARPNDATALTAADRECCSSATVLVGASGAADRVDAGALAAVAAPVAVPRYQQFSQPHAQIVRPSVAPPPPPRAPIVLRV